MNIMKIEISLDGDTVERDLNREMDIIPENLDDEMRAFPGLLCWWSLLAARAKAERETIEKEIKALEADLDLELRNPRHVKMLQDEGYRVTESMIASRIRSSESWRALNKRWSDARSRELKLDGVVRSLEAKHTLIIQMNADRRQERRIG